MDNEREIEFDYVGFCMGTRCMQRARDGIPHSYKRQVAWATNTLSNWLNGNGPPPEVRRDRDFPSWRECQRHRLAQERRRKTKLLYYR